MIQIREELPEDTDAIRAVLKSAFPTYDEADIVDTLRNNNKNILSLVAFYKNTLAGHVLFTNAHVENNPNDAVFLGLAPVSVLPEHQKKGIGSKLIEFGINELKSMHCDAIVVLGYPEYYHRFGFEKANAYDFQNKYGVDAEFMLKILHNEQVKACGGMILFEPEFDSISE